MGGINRWFKFRFVPTGKIQEVWDAVERDRHKSFSPDQFSQYVETLTFGAWRPKFVVLHNTGAPTLQQWLGGPTTPQQRILNLEAFYRDEQKWSAGPHLFIDNHLIWAFTPLTTSGVHSPSWNSISWGVEMVGDYTQEEFDKGPGASVAENTVKALATLHTLMGLDPEDIHFHKEDPKTTHRDCPGDNVDKDDMIARIRQQMGGDHPAGEIPIA